MFCVSILNRAVNDFHTCHAGVLALLRPLLLDTVPSIQQSAALALGRLAEASDELASAVVTSDILPQLVYSMADQNRCVRLCNQKTQLDS